MPPADRSHPAYDQPRLDLRRSPQVSDVARIAGTRVAVHRIAGFYRLGYSPEEIASFLNSISLAQVFAALAHALANPEEIEKSLPEEEQTGQRLTTKTSAA